MARLRCTVVVLTLLLGSAAAAAPPAPPPPIFEPEVIYSYNGSKAVDLRLASADGTKAVLLHRAAAIRSYDLGPKSQRIAAFIERDATTPNSRLIVTSWAYDTAGAVVVGSSRELYEGVLLFADFSPGGDRISFLSQNTFAPNPITFTIKTIDVASGLDVRDIAQVADGEALWLRWSVDGNSLYYINHLTPGGHTAFRQPIDGGPHTPLFSEANIGPWDIWRNGREGLVFGFSRPGFTQATMGNWDGATVAAIPSLIGGTPHYSCGNNRLIYKSYSSSGQPGPVKVFTFATGADVVFSKDRNVGRADFIAC